MATTTLMSNDVAPRSDVGDFRELMASFPTGVSVVTATGGDNLPMGLTCSSLASVCTEPPTLMVCLNVHSATLGATLSSGRFGVNLLHDGAEAAARAFAGSADRFERVDWRWSWSGLPWLHHDSLAFADCVVRGHQLLGDHEVVFGEVTGVVVGTDAPLVYGLRNFRSWSDNGRVTT